MRIAIFGKSENDWGLEGTVSRELNKNKRNMEFLDINAFNMGSPFTQEYDALVFIQGRRIWRELLYGYKGKKVLWNTEFWPYWGKQDNQEALVRLNLVEPLEDFNLILNGCPLSTKFLNDKRNVNVEWFPMFGVSKDFYDRIEGVEKSVDIGFFGHPSSRRIGFWNKLISESSKSMKRPLKIVWRKVYGKSLVEFINSCRIILNIHYTELLNTESRIYETLACGTYCLSEELSYPDLFLGGVHLGVASIENISKIAIDMVMEDYPFDVVAHRGYEFVHENFNTAKVLDLLEEKIARLV